MALTNGNGTDTTMLVTPYYGMPYGGNGGGNGLFGGGGGSVLVPLLIGLCKLEPRRAFATSVAIILPLCIVSVWFYLRQGAVELSTALPYAAGGALGGWLGGKLFRQTNMTWLRRFFGLLLDGSGHLLDHSPTA